MTTLEVQFVGSGGQGIVFLGFILSRAAVIYEGKDATNIQSYGSRMRGGSTISDIIISDEDVICPVVSEPDILVALADESLEEFAASLKEGALLLIDESVKFFPKNNFKVFRIPAAKIAESDFKSRTPANMIMLGALIGITDLVSEEAILNSLLDVMEELDLREKVKERNIQALIKGIKLGRALTKD
ncbi:MAG: 2-oxoacid:acceptor oxidoreductase family protein [Candidatus Jordarchaeum sp.]|uniref:2-oxoacid:acceptor oxidoreductase family protein n=1 Tax=Candidatus Jordarchaeum sp. TaxID=2823881 RepID=UPI00404A3271